MRLASTLAPSLVCLDNDLLFDPSMWRHCGRVARHSSGLRRRLHFTGRATSVNSRVSRHRLSIRWLRRGTRISLYASRRLRLPWASRASLNEAKAWLNANHSESDVVYRFRVWCSRRIMSAVFSRAGPQATFVMSRGVNTDVFRSPPPWTEPIVNTATSGGSREKKGSSAPGRRVRAGAEGLDVRFTIVATAASANGFAKTCCAQSSPAYCGVTPCRCVPQMMFAFPSETLQLAMPARRNGVGSPRRRHGSRRTALLVDDGQTAIVAPMVTRSCGACEHL